MRQEFGRTVESSFSPLSDSHPKLLGVPIDDDGGQQVQTRDAEVLTFSGAIADFALPPDPQCALQSMVGLAFVETYLGAALHLGIEQPFDDKQCPFDPPDSKHGWALAFVETYPRRCISVLSQPFDDKQCPFDPPDFAQPSARSCCRGRAANFLRR